MKKPLQVLVKESVYALVLGADAGDDKVRCFPTPRSLRWVKIGSIVVKSTLEQCVNDPEQGLRKIEKIFTLKRLSVTTGFVNAKNTKKICFTQSDVVEVIEKETILMESSGEGVHNMLAENTLLATTENLNEGRCMTT